MTDRQEKLRLYQENAKEAFTTIQNKGFKFIDEPLIWQILVYQLEHCEIPTEVIHHNLSTSEIVSFVETYFRKNGLPINAIEFSGSILLREIDSFKKAEIKFKGSIWTIHKNDQDTFPSNPHAHNYEEHFKLHLGTGKLYRSKICIGSIKSKDFLILRNLISTKINGIVLPKLEIN